MRARKIATKERKEEGKTKMQMVGQLDCICGHSLAKIGSRQKYMALQEEEGYTQPDMK